jgi:hypothetical protein
LVMIGTRVLTTSDAFNVAAGSRPGIRTMTDRVRPSIALSPAPPAATEHSVVPRFSDGARPAGAPAIPAITSEPPTAQQTPRSAAAAPAEDITGSIPQSEPGEMPARRPAAVAASALPATPPVSELSGSIFSHAESQPNVEPDWKRNPRRRSAITPTR